MRLGRSTKGARLNLGTQSRAGRHPYLWIVILSILVAALVTGGAIHAIRKGYDDAIARAEANLRNLTLVLSEQTDRAIQALEVLQDDIIGRLIQDGAQTTDDLRRIGSQRAIHAMIGQKFLALPQADGIALLDAHGQGVATSRQWPLVGEQDLSSRDYYQALASDPDLTTFISQPILTLDVGKRTVIIARKISSKARDFIGVLVVSMELSYFENLYRSLVTNKTGTINLYRRDGVLLARYPPYEAAPDDGVRQREVALAVALGAGQQSMVRGESPYDGKERVAAGHVLSRYPLLVVASETVEAIVSGWKEEAVVIGGVALLMNLALGAALVLGYRVTKVSIGRAEKESYLARHDVLTDLPNRLLFGEEMEHAVKHIQEGRGSFALFLLDLDHFKDVNDSHGHPVGDSLLKAVTHRLQANIGSSDLIARIGGDEFALVQRDVSGRQDVVTMADRLMAAMSEPYSVEMYILSIGATLGIAIAPEHGTTADDLLKAADLALYASKGERKPNYRIFDTELSLRRMERRILEDELQEAIGRHQFELHYQPILDLSSDTIIGFEALVRWKHIKKGLIPPAIFIPVIEELGLICVLGDWILESACREAVTWPGDIKVAVNLSPLQFKGGDIFSSVHNATERSGLSPSRLELEITENILLDKEVQTILPQIRSLGVSIALDDFGTGYASLSYLCRFPFDKIKIDQSFVREMQTSASSMAVVHASCYLAEKLGIVTTAEGVEAPEQLEILRGIGVTQVQGYLISKPLPAIQIPTFLAGYQQLVPV